MLDLIEPFLKANFIKYVQYDSSMTKSLLKEAFDKIKMQDKVRIVLISFKADSTDMFRVLLVILGVLRLSLL
ncbi:hypothetical protein BDY19DRAFT_995729 [Irpex rosettiformis]|uniref:Uncharacterized protein n=1 Tax=Irpex rosettiformis TaxID=378272 RepID=A0ACB8TXF6_9APHY|nr:hypothetical protein BDY19DRAFT_995729 [Irpex rosettiformis]